MVDLTRLLPRLELLEEQSASRMRLAVRQKEVVQEQLARLSEYRSDYHAVHALKPVLMVDAQCFVERLDVSIAELSQRLDRQLRVVNAEEKRWKKARARRLSVEIYIDKLSLELRAKKRRQEINLAESLQGSHKFVSDE